MFNIAARRPARRKRAGHECALLPPFGASPSEIAGCDRLTIAPDLLHKLADDHGMLARRLSPQAPGPAPAKIALDEKSFRWLLNDDAMATEKLAEGIRVFARDLGSLRELVGRRLAKAA